MRTTDVACLGMLLSYSHEFIFFHVPRTAGTSVSGALTSLAHDPLRVFVNRALDKLGFRVNHILGPSSWKRFRIHQSARGVCHHLPASLFARFFKFAFVRNPWDWLVSYYHHVVQCPDHGRHRRLMRIACFEDFIRWKMTRRRNRQLDLLADRDGRLLVDFVGRYERLEEDFHEISRRLSVRVDLPRLNRSRHDDYRRYYSDNAAQLVADYWRPDIQAFGYDFDGPSG